MRFATISLLLFDLAVSAGAVDYLRGISVMDFGARGDGVTDDTMAIQRALNFVRNTDNRVLLARQPTLEGAPHLGNPEAVMVTGENTSVPEIFFPAGTYLISETLVGGAYLYLRGENGSRIRQTVADKDIIYVRRGFRLQVRNLTFDGGRRQIVHWTGNEDISNVVFENCRFENSSGVAFFSHNFLNPNRTNYADTTYGAYEVKWEGEKPILTPNNENERYFNNSTLFVFSDCVFNNCREILHLNADGIVIENCRIWLPAGTAAAAMYISGPTRITNMKAVADDSAGAGWILAENFMYVENSDFQVKSGGGMPLITFDMSKRSDTTQSHIVVRDTGVQCRTAPLIYCIDFTPNMIEATNVRETSGQTVKLIEWKVPPTEQAMRNSIYDLTWLFEHVKGSKYSTDFPFNITVDRCRNISLDNLPEFLRRALEPPLPPEVMKSVEISPVKIAPGELNDVFKRTLHAIDYGVDGDPQTDDTAAMRRVLDAVGGEPALIVLPPVLISLSEPLDLPAEVAFTAPGLATLRQDDIGSAIFKGENQKSLRAENLRLVSGSCAFELRTDPDEAASILIDKCFFYQQLNTSVNVQAGDGSAGLANKTRLLLKRSTFVAPVSGVATNADHSEIYAFWVSTNARMDRQAFITNRGNMRIADMLGVPITLTEHVYNFLPVIKGWPYSNHIRWFDNYGSMYALNCRYGGEYRGIPLVHNFSGSGTLMLDVGITCFDHPGQRKCMVFFEEIPRIAVIMNAGIMAQWPDSQTAKTASAVMEKPEIYVRNFHYEKESFEAK